MLYMVLVCLQICLSFFKINLIGKFLKSWIYPYTPGMLYIHYGKLYLHKQKFFSHNSISFKNLLSISAKFDSYLFTTFTMFISASSESWTLNALSNSKFLRITDKAQFLCVSSYSNKHFVHSYENNTDTVTTLQINLSIVCSKINDNLQCRPQWVTNLVHLKY